MPLPQLLEQVAKRPSMYFTPVEYDVAAAFLQGFDLANSGGILVGFREWLIVKFEFGSNLTWSALILRMLFPESESPHESLQQSGAQTRAVEFLFDIVEEFWHEREGPQGLRRVYLKYQAWLQQQDWYGPASPDYYGDDSNPLRTALSEGKKDVPLKIKSRRAL